MILCKKKQARFWCISLLYKHRKRKLKLINLPTSCQSVTELEAHFDDSAVFAYNKGDLKYFLMLYKAIYNNFLEIKSTLDSRFKYMNDFMVSAFICFIAELKYLNIDQPLLITIYASILNDYEEGDHFKLLSTL